MQNLQIHHRDSALLRLINLIQNLLHIHHGELVLFITFGKPHAKAPDTSRRFDFITFGKPHRKPPDTSRREWTLFITFGKPHTKPPDTSRRVDS